jgi:hypothetical protein
MIKDFRRDCIYFRFCETEVDLYAPQCILIGELDYIEKIPYSECMECECYKTKGAS